MKKSLLVVLALATALGAALFGSSRLAVAHPSSSAIVAPSFLKLPPAAPAGQSVLWGHIKTLVRKGGRFEMKFDPAWWLNGVTGSRAAREDTGSGDVPNDYYVVDEGHRLLTYVVPASAHVTVITNAGGLRSTPISVRELAQIVKGKNPRDRPLFDRQNGLGYWIRVGNKYPNPALSLDQQYQP